MNTQTFRTRWHVGAVDITLAGLWTAAVWLPLYYDGLRDDSKLLPLWAAVLIGGAVVAIQRLRARSRSLTISETRLDFDFPEGGDGIRWNELRRAKHYFDGDHEGWYLSSKDRSTDLDVRLEGFTASDIEEINRLIRKATLQIEPTPKPSLGAERDAIAASGTVQPKLTLAEASVPEFTSNHRPCPFCAELIQRAAVVCRFCNRDVRRTPA